MKPPRINYFGIKVTLGHGIPAALLYQQATDELFLGPHVRLAGLSGMAHIDSESLAQRYAEACTTVLQKRHGNDAQCEVVRCEGTGDKKLADRIERDSDVIRMRLKTGNLASNRKVEF